MKEKYEGRIKELMVEKEGTDNSGQNEDIIPKVNFYLKICDTGIESNYQNPFKHIYIFRLNK